MYLIKKDTDREIGFVSRNCLYTLYSEREFIKGYNNTFGVAPDTYLAGYPVAEYPVIFLPDIR